MPARLTISKRDDIAWGVLHDIEFRFRGSGAVNWAALARKHSTCRRTCERVWRSYRLENGLGAVPPIDPIVEPPSEFEEGALSDWDASMEAPSLGEASDVGTEGECNTRDEVCEGDGQVHENEDSSTETRLSPEPDHLGELQAGITKLKKELERLMNDVHTGSGLVALAARCEELSRSPRIAWIRRWIEPHKMKREAAEKKFFGVMNSVSRRAWAAYYELSNFNVAWKLVELKRKGYDVRVLLCSNLRMLNEGPMALFVLRKAGIPVHVSNGSRLFHRKGLILDDMMGIGSANMSAKAFSDNVEDIWFIQGEYAAKFSASFEDEWAHGSKDFEEVFTLNANRAPPPTLPPTDTETLKVLAGVKFRVNERSVGVDCT